MRSVGKGSCYVRQYQKSAIASSVVLLDLVSLRWRMEQPWENLPKKIAKIDNFESLELHEGSHAITRQRVSRKVASCVNSNNSIEGATNLEMLPEINIHARQSPFQGRQDHIQCCGGIDYLASLPPPSDALLAEHRRKNNGCSRRKYLLNAQLEMPKKSHLHHQSAADQPHEASSVDMVKPWMSYHFSQPHHIAPLSGSHSISSSSSRDSSMNRAFLTDQKWGSEVSADKEVFFSCKSRHVRHQYLKESTNKVHRKISEKKRSAHSDEADSICSSQGAVCTPTSQYLSPISFSRNCAVVEIMKSISGTGGSQDSLSEIPLVPNPTIKLSAYQVNQRLSSIQMHATPSSTTCSNEAKDNTKGPPVAILSSNSNLNSVSIISFVSYHTSIIDDDDGEKNYRFNEEVSDTTIVSSKLCATTESLLGEILSHSGNAMLADFLNGVPLTNNQDRNELRCSTENDRLVVQQPSRSLYTISVDNFQDSPSSRYSQCTFSTNSMNKCTLSTQVKRVSASREGKPMEAQLQDSNVCSNISTSENPSECKKSSISSLSQSELLCPGSEPQIHTSDGKTFLPPELSDVAANHDCLNNCTYTLVKRTIFNPTRYQTQQHDNQFSFLTSSDSPSVSESTFRSLTTRQDQSSASLFTHGFGGQGGSISSSVSVVPVPNVKKSSITTSMSYHSAITDTIQPSSVSTLKSDDTLKTNEGQNVDVLGRSDSHNINRFKGDANKPTVRGQPCTSFPLVDTKLTNKSGDLKPKIHLQHSSLPGKVKKEVRITKYRETKPTHSHEHKTKPNKTLKSKLMKVVSRFFKT